MEKIIAAGPVIVKDGRLLVSRDWKDEFYKLPGGTLQEGEELIDCALRELKEETNFEGRIIESLPSFSVDKRPVTGEDVEIELNHFRVELNQEIRDFRGFEYENHEVRWLLVRDIMEGKFNVAPNIYFLIEQGKILPWINYLTGTKKGFYEFVSMITPRDKVAILTHTDVDGLASAVFLEEILEAKNVGIEEIEFLDMTADMVKKILFKLKEKEITKVFFCDLSVDKVDAEGLEEMSKEMDFFILDHHPMEENFNFKKHIIKSASEDCAAMLIYDLGQGVFDTEEWNWLLGAAMFSDYSYRIPKNFEIMKEMYPGLTFENISGSIPGINARKINSAATYYNETLEHVFEIIKMRNLDQLSQVHDIVEEEVERLVNDFFENEKFNKKKNLHVYEVISNFKLSSTIATMISKMKEQGVFVFYQKWKDGVHASARSNAGIVDVSLLMKECTEGLEDANGGGHKQAAGAKLLEKDLEVFLDRLRDSKLFFSVKY